MCQSSSWLCLDDASTELVFRIQKTDVGDHQQEQIWLESC